MSNQLPRTSTTLTEPILSSSPRRPIYTTHSTALSSRELTVNPRARNATDTPRGGSREWSIFEQVLLDNENTSRLSQYSRSSSPVQPLTSEFRRRRALTSASFNTAPSVNSAASSFIAPEISSEPSPITGVEADQLESLQPSSPDEYDSDFSDSDNSSTATVTRNATENEPHPFWKKYLHIPADTTLHRDILKCALAYFIGSLFTFIPSLSSLIADLIPYRSTDGPSPAAHMVATVAVYFNPAKTLGGMMEADIYCIGGAAFAAVVTLLSMDSFWFFELKPGWEWLADLITFFWIAIAMTLVAYTKLRMNKPSFSPAASMTSIIIFVTVVKEGGIETLLEVIFIVFIGVTISNLVCAILWPRSATAALQNDIKLTLNSFATLLQMLTQTFLLQANLHPHHEKVLAAVSAHQSSFTSLKKSLSEARSEWWSSRIQVPSDAYDNVVDSTRRLAQHLGGLRTGTKIQFGMAGRKREANGGHFHLATDSNGNGTEDGEENLHAVKDLFQELVDDLEAPMNALAATCARTLKKVRSAFVQDQSKPSNQSDAHDFDKLSAEIGRALFQFERTSNYALGRLYSRSTNLETANLQHHRTSEDDEDIMFLIYFFIFTLQEFARELITLVEAMSTIHDSERSIRTWGQLFRTWLPLSFMARSQSNRSTNARNGGPTPSLRTKISNLVLNTDKEAKPPRTPKSLFPRVQPHAPNTMHLPPPQSLSLIGRIGQLIWVTLQWLKEPDVKYAIKTGAATAILALPAFLDSTREVFVRWRGEWALISFFVVMSKTIGATNLLSIHRVIGTVIGAITAAIISTLFPKYPIVLAVFGFFFSIPCFYYIVGKPQYATSGRFVLLTYNLTCLFSYNSRYAGTAVWGIAFHRAFAVTVGVVWALIVSRWWWPSEARRELSKGLGEFCLNIGWLYTALVRSYSAPGSGLEEAVHYPPATTATATSAEFEDVEQHRLLPSTSTDNLNASIRRFMEMELHLQLKLLELQGLLSQAQNEPRLKGPFPVALYRSILTSLQTILDNLHSMRCVTTKEEWLANVHRQFILPVNKERREMAGNVILYFSTLSAAFWTKSPLSPYLPDAESARRRLMEAIRELDVLKQREARGSNLVYALYGLMTKGIITELDFLGKTAQDAFGVVGGTEALEEFEALFHD